MEDLHSLELARIQEEYRRRDREIAPDFYSLARPSNLFARQQLVSQCMRLLGPNGMQNRRIADIGCGEGTWFPEFIGWGAAPSDLAGIDLDDVRIARASNTAPAADLRLGSATNLPWPDHSFDIVSQFTVFSSVLSQPMQQSIASEMLRVLKPGGIILWYDLRVNNPRNKAVQGILSESLGDLFPHTSIRTESATLAPPVARFLVPKSRSLALLLEALPFLRSHLLALIRKPA